MSKIRERPLSVTAMFLVITSPSLKVMFWCLFEKSTSMNWKEPF